MVWAGISRGGRTDLHIVMRGMMTSVRYMDEILDMYWCNRIPVHPYGHNARPRRARLVEEYLQL